LAALRAQLLRDLLFARAPILVVRNPERDASRDQRAEHGQREDSTSDADEPRHPQILRHGIDRLDGHEGHAFPLRQTCILFRDERCQRQPPARWEGTRDGAGFGGWTRWSARARTATRPPLENARDDAT